MKPDPRTAARRTTSPRRRTSPGPTRPCRCPRHLGWPPTAGRTGTWCTGRPRNGQRLQRDAGTRQVSLEGLEHLGLDSRLVVVEDGELEPVLVTRRCQQLLGLLRVV